MLTKIKALADEAIKLQNKNRMDEVLREISALCNHKQILYQIIDKPEKVVLYGAEYKVPKEEEAEFNENLIKLSDSKEKTKGAKNAK